MFMIHQLNPVFWPEATIDPEIFAPIAEVGHNIPLDSSTGARGVTFDSMIVGNDNKPLAVDAAFPDLLPAYQEVIEFIRQSHGSYGRLSEYLQIAFVSVRTSEFEPLWHSHVFPGVFSISPDASCIGARGNLDVTPPRHASELADAVTQTMALAAQNGGIETIGLTEVTPPAGACVAVPRDSPHKSPEHDGPRIVALGNNMPPTLGWLTQQR